MTLIATNEAISQSTREISSRAKGLRVAVVQHWLTSYGGAERVLEGLAGIFPHADFYAPVVSKRGIPAGLRGWNIKSSFIGRIPGVKHWHRHFLPFYPYALEQFDLSEYDLVISSEAGPAKGVLTGPRTCHICYCHSPMRYIWDMYHEYRRNMNPVTRAVFSLTSHYARMWDVTTAARVDRFVANSRHVASRIRKYYRRESTVIYPPVNVEAGYISRKIEDYYLVVGRLVAYKRVDLAIEACNRLGRPLRIVGEGPEYKRLKRLAGPTIEFVGRLDDQSLQENYAHCRALIFPGEEDFGIVPVESQSFGRPIIAYGSGGALETIVGLHGDDKSEVFPFTGVFFDAQTVGALAASIERFEAAELSFCPEAIRQHAKRFDSKRFDVEFIHFVNQMLGDFNNPVRIIADGGRTDQILAASQSGNGG